MVKFAVDEADNWDAADETSEEEAFSWEEDLSQTADPDEFEGEDYDVAEEPGDEVTEDVGGPEGFDETDLGAGGYTDSEREPQQYESDAGVDETPEIEPQFANVVEWVEGYFLPIIRRRIGDNDGGLSWDARWWAYPEVVARLTALYFAWEEARKSDSMSAMSSWWIQHLEPHLRVILDGDTGPMANAKTTRDWMGWPAMPADDVPSDVFDRIVNNGGGAAE